jgi:hypothetical protein
VSILIIEKKKIIKEFFFKKKDQKRKEVAAGGGHTPTLGGWRWRDHPWGLGVAVLPPQRLGVAGGHPHWLWVAVQLVVTPFLFSFFLK